ncbi:hypothetical protein [Shewanella maritima]|uniref:hypothetical protein n=1 Tax=Shewanella maritima TaxID=2520507 RepID=UPI0037369658
MLLASLFCHQGHDQSFRFASIAALAFILTILSGVIFPSSLFAVVISLLFAAIAGLSGLRRIRNANLPQPLVAVIPSLLLLFSVSQYVQVGLGWLSPIATVLIAIIVWLSLKSNAYNNMHFVQGYYGPKLTTTASLRTVQQRREPVLSGDVLDDVPHIDGEQPDLNRTQPTLKPDAGADDGLNKVTSALRSWASSNRNTVKVTGISLAVITVVILVTVVVFKPNQDQSLDLAPQVVETEPKPSNVPRISVKLPDGFWLEQEQDILIIRWLGEEGVVRNIWSLASAKGDKSCANLEFNNRAKYRPMTVDLTADSSSEARFSPLDSQAIIKDVAMRGSFSLCGYQFSLAGSQVALSRQPEFAKLL